MNVELLKKCSKFIAAQEGCKLTAYQDQGGVWTIGFGATGPSISAGVTWTQREADERLEHDVARFLEGVQGLVKVKLTDNQIVALTSFSYNVGLHNFQRSGCLRFLNREQFKEAMDNLLLWNKIGSYTNKGLTARREREKKLFEGQNA